jgi:transcriptional regulator with XRE-family HTH domain
MTMYAQPGSASQHTYTPTVRFWPEQAQGTSQTQILDEATNAQFDSILFLGESTGTTSTFAAIAGWFTSSSSSPTLGILPQWLAYEATDLVSYWGIETAYGRATSLPVSIELETLRDTLSSDSTQIVPGVNVFEVFAPAIAMYASQTETTTARLILLSEAVARKARRVFLAPSSAVPNGPLTGQSRNMAVEALDAVRDLTQLLLLPAEDVAELCGFTPATLGNWQAGRIPQMSKVRRLFHLQALVKALRAALGPDSYNLWLNAPDAGGRPRIDLLATDTGLQTVLGEAAPFIFAPQGNGPSLQPDFEENEALVRFAEEYVALPPATAPPRRLHIPPGDSSSGK